MKNHINFNMHNTIRPICLPENPSTEYENALAIVAGWGLAGSGLSGSVSHDLQKVDVLLMSHNDCQTAFQNSVTKEMICIKGSSESVGSTCPGDSGGGIFYKNGNKYEVVGIVSWDTGTVGCQDYMPSVAARVTSVLGWIQRETGDSHFCRA